jgi:hypothetical protein
MLTVAEESTCIVPKASVPCSVFEAWAVTVPLNIEFMLLAIIFASKYAFVA